MGSLRKGIGLGRNGVRKSGSEMWCLLRLDSAVIVNQFFCFVPRVQKIFALVEYLRVIFLPTLYQMTAKMAPYLVRFLVHSRAYKSKVTKNQPQATPQLGPITQQGCKTRNAASALQG